VFKQRAQELARTLTSVDLSQNHLHQLPVELCMLTKLETLDLSSNEITEVPPQIAQLKALVKLNLHNNLITYLCTEVAQLVRLEELDISNNSIDALPPSLYYLTLRDHGRLRQIDADETDLRSPPVAVVRAGMHELRRYFDTLAEVENAKERQARREFLAAKDKQRLERLGRLAVECSLRHTSPLSPKQKHPPYAPSPKSTTNSWSFDADGSRQRSHTCIQPHLQRSTTGPGGGSSSGESATGRGGQGRSRTFSGGAHCANGSMDNGGAVVTVESSSIGSEAAAVLMSTAIMATDSVSLANTMLGLCTRCRPLASNLLREVGQNCIELLALFSCPRTLPQLQLMREIKELQQAVSVHLQEVCPAVLWPDDVQSALRKTWPRILQFSGHGYDGHGPAKGMLYFERRERRERQGGGSQYVHAPYVPAPEEFIELLEKSQAPRLEVVFLNGCKTKAIGERIVASLHHLQVVCWDTLLDDKAASAFARGFYGTIGEMSTDDSQVEVSRAFEAGKREMAKHGFQIG
jgi:hypothetical protein